MGNTITYLVLIVTFLRIFLSAPLCKSLLEMDVGASLVECHYFPKPFSAAPWPSATSDANRRKKVLRCRWWKHRIHAKQGLLWLLFWCWSPLVDLDFSKVRTRTWLGWTLAEKGCSTPMIWRTASWTRPGTKCWARGGKRASFLIRWKLECVRKVQVWTRWFYGVLESWMMSLVV